MRSCICRVRCGTMPSIRSISISWPRWCISCSLVPNSHLEAGFGRRRHAGRELDALREKIVGLALQPLRPPLCLIKTFCAGKMNQCRYSVVSTLECCWGNERYSGLWLSENGRKSRQTTAIFRDV